MEWGVLGHEWAARMLQQHIARQEVRHAYLFTGPSGVGRRTLALRFAQALNCTEPPAPGQSCGGKCRTCRQIEQMQHPDLSIVQAENEGGTLKIDQIRALQHTLSLAPYQARYRVALMLYFDGANANAQNALLKTLEEAPEKVILLLTADSAENLLPTIVSRCEVLRLHPLQVERLAEALHERWSLPVEESRLLAHLSSGRPGYALRLHNDPASLEQRRGWLDSLQELLSSPRRLRFAYAEKLLSKRGRDFAKSRETLRQVMQVWLSFWRDLLLSTAGSTVPLVNLDRENEIRRLAELLDLHTARACTEALEKSLSLLDNNINPQLLLEVLLLDWPRLN
jgi:DNA polymerase III subunit delta'